MTVRTLVTRRRRPVRPVLQMGAGDCGAACLTMVLNHHGVRIRLSECRERLGAGRDGATALNIARAARAYGLHVTGFSSEPAVLSNVRLPAIVHWNFNHFVVLERWSAQYITIVDPALGRRRLRPAEFSAGFTGVVLVFSPGVGAAGGTPAARMSVGPYLKTLVLAPGCRALLAQVMLASLLLQLFGLGIPALTKTVVDAVLPSGRGDLTTTIGIGLSILLFVQSTTAYLRSMLLAHLRARLDSRMMLDFFAHLLDLPYRFFQQRANGDLLMRLSSNAAIREFLTSQSLSALLDGPVVTLYLVVLWMVHPIFAAAVLFVGALQVFLLVGTGPRVRRLAERELAASAASQSRMVETLAAMATVKAGGGEATALARWSRLFLTQLNASFERERVMAAVNTSLMALRTYSPVILLCFGANQVLDGSLSLGELFAATTLAASFLAPLGSLVASGQQVQFMAAHLDRVLDVVETRPEQDISRVSTSPALTGRIEMRDVCFRYDPNSPMVLESVTLSINPGQRVAFVGRTGSGKSTLLKLLLGLYQPVTGDILYDGVSLNEINYRTLRRQCGVVLQDSHLLSGSIRENIAFDNPELPAEQLVAAATMAQIHDDVVRLPMGYDTLLPDGGSGLSGGERQRLAIARALARQPAILFFDEATSHLDAVTERRLEQVLSALPSTRIVIAHRLSTIRDADVIVVLDRGRIVERGTHDDLLALDGHYAGLVRDQGVTASTPAEASANAGDWRRKTCVTGSH